MTFQTSANDLLTPTKYLVDSNAYAGKFTTIASAITAAVADGASSSAQKVILIKPGSYTEDLTLSDGIVLKGWNDIKNEISAFYPDSAVVITGQHSLSSGSAWTEQITFKNTSDIFDFSGGTLYINNCGLYSTDADSIAFSGTDDKFLIIDKSNLYPSGTGVAFSTDGSNSAIKIYTRSTQIRNETTQSSFTGAGSLKWDDESGSLGHRFDFSTTTVNLSFTYAYFSSGSGTIITTGASTTGVCAVNFCLFNSSAPFSIGNAGFTIGDDHGSATSWNGNTFQNSQTYGKINTSNRATNPEFIKSIKRTGYHNSESRHTQSWVQTTDATQTTIWSRTLATGQGITIHATISGMIDDYSAYCGGDVLGSARNAGAGAVLVGTTSRVLEDSSGVPNFVINVNGNDVRIQVTGIVAETWNWASTINFQLIETDD